MDREDEKENKFTDRNQQHNKQIMFVHTHKTTYYSTTYNKPDI